jgi:hypothetical protein
MRPFFPVTETELDRARHDPAFRQKLLQRSLDALLSGLQKHRQSPRTVADSSEKQIREGVALAVRLAELIQTRAGPARGR